MMHKKYRNCNGLHWQVMDVRDLRFDDCYFDIAFDKGRRIRSTIFCDSLLDIVEITVAVVVQCPKGHP